MGDDDKHFCAFAIGVKYMFTRLQMKIQWYNVSFHISLPPLDPACKCTPPQVARLSNSYLDEWLKLRHSQQVSLLLFREEWDSCHLLMHCLPSHMQIPCPHRCLPAPPSLPTSAMGPQSVALGDWSDSMATLETCEKSAHPASQAKITPACWSDMISERGGTVKDYCTQLIYGCWSQCSCEQSLLASESYSKQLFALSHIHVCRLEHAESLNVDISSVSTALPY